MATTYRWHKTVSNSYLGKTKVIRGMTRAEVEQKAAMQLTAWAQEENKKRAQYQAQAAKQAEQDHLRLLEHQAASGTQEAKQRITALQELLKRGLLPRNQFNWESYKRNAPYPPFRFTEPIPTYEQVAANLRVPAENRFMEGIFSSKRERRQQLEQQAQTQYGQIVQQHKEREAKAQAEYDRQRLAFLRAQDEYNGGVDARRSQYKQGFPDAVVWVLTEILKTLHLPEDYGTDYDVSYEQSSGIACINMQLPAIEEIPRISGYRFVKSRKAVEPNELKSKEVEALYDTTIYQIALLTMDRIFRESDPEVVKSVVFNGWVNGIDKKTGNDFTSCILSVQASHDEFLSLNLERVVPKECFRSLKGVTAGPLAQLAPVRPVLDLSRQDKRFIESREVLEGLDSSDNLATMDWEDFEHLVRELFGKVFGGDGAEVRITQASRDLGVDAVAFDPDPIRGGKFVIQAKRYNNVVPVSAVRDLYGTMINEGASRGILVTTSYYGNESREFAKDKPLTLIDGANLIHMFQEYGYNVTIELQRK